MGHGCGLRKNHTRVIFCLECFHYIGAPTGGYPSVKYSNRYSKF